MHATGLSSLEMSDYLIHKKNTYFWTIQSCKSMNAIFIFFLMTTTVVGVIIDLSPPTAPNPHYTNKKFQGQRDIPSASSRLVLSNNLASGLVIQWRMRKCELGYETPVRNVGTRWCFALVSACCLFSSFPQYHIAFKETKPSVSFTRTEPELKRRFLGVRAWS